MVHLKFLRSTSLTSGERKDKKFQLIIYLEIHGDNPALLFNVLSKRLCRTTSTGLKNKRM
jgi:hypothetical protein